jgi:hypothetical protein
VSVKDWWVGPHEQVLKVPIACRCYGPGNPSSMLSIEGGFTPTASMTGSREKLGTDPQIGQSSCCGLCWEPFFFGAVALSIAVDDCMKGYCIWTTWDTYGRGPYVERAWKACGVFEIPTSSSMSLSILQENLGVSQSNSFKALEIPIKSHRILLNFKP